MSDIFSVTDQVVLVSGGTRGIGFAIAAGFAQRGANVVVTGRTPEGANAAAAKLAAGARLPPVGVACDVAQADHRVADLAARHQAALRLRVFLACALCSTLFLSAAMRSMTSALGFASPSSGSVISSVWPAFTLAFTRARMSSR